MEEVVKPQCVGCNLYGGGKLARFSQKLIAELGLEKWNELLDLSNKIVQYKSTDYQDIERMYKDRVTTIGGDFI